MTINDYKLRRMLIGAALFMAMSTVLGRFVVLPFGRQIIGAIPPWITGMGLVSLGMFIGEAVICTMENIRSFRHMDSEFPKYTEDIRLAGVETPVDFCFAMTHRVNYIKLSVLPGKHLRGWVYSNKKAIKGSIKVFEERFGRKPAGAESFDWNYMSLLEAANQLGKDEDEVSGNMILEIITDSVVKYYENRNHGTIELF